uniref:glycosyltransferase family 8 protein n=1 Tax=Brachyspira catarrhinii TaxID=2528966 RepID=UPI003F4BCED4
MDICLSADENYAKYMAATIASILSNSKEDEELYFHLIVDDDVTDDSKNKLLSLKKIKNCEMKFYSPNIEKYKKWYELGNYTSFSPAMFYRLSIAELIKNVDRVLYLDCDIIVNDSLKELFEIDINNYYILAVKDIYFIDSKKDINESYFNSGVLVINSKLWLENNVSELFENYYLNNYKNIYTDQDVLNYCLKEKVKYLDDIWNYLPLKSLYTGKSIENIKILHYAASAKPWNSNGRIFYFVDEFWKYYQLTPWFLERPIDAIQTILAQKYSDYEKTKLKINDVRFFGVYHNRNTLEIVIFFIKIRIEMSFKNVNKIAWFIPVKKWREAFKRAFDV